MSDAQLLGIVGALIVVVLLPLISWLGKRQINALEQGCKEQMASLKQDINSIGGKVQLHHDEMLRDYVHEDRLKERMESALQPIAASLSRIERVMDNDIREIFSKLDRKQERER